MSKSYNKNSSLSSPNLNIFSNLLDKSLSFANYLPLPFLKFISLFSLSLLQSESIIISDIASTIVPLKNTSLDSAERYITRSLRNPNYDFHHFYFKFIQNIMSTYKVKHDDNKVIISLDHMYVEDRYTILMFTLRVGKTGIPLWFKEFKYHDSEAYTYPIFKEAIQTCHDLVKLNNPDAKIKFLADRWFGNHVKILDYINIIGDTYTVRAKGSLLTLTMDKKEGHTIWKNINKLDAYIYKSKFYPHAFITREHRFETNIVISPSYNHKEPLYLLTDEIDKIDTKISGERLKELRKEFNLTQSRLAKKLNIANTIISEYESGHFPVSTATLYSLSDKFNISSDYLLGKTNKIKYLDKPKEKELIG